MIGQTISHYRILEKLGEGGMGVVYKAYDARLQREVALKFLPHYLATDSTEKERFYHEARAASALNHPNVTTIYDINEFENQLYLAMEYVEGKTLKQLVEPEILAIKKVLDIAIQACDGLAAAHEKGIVHRDIKSENIMLTPKGQVKIMDFGLAKVKGATKLTKEGSTLGTAAYMSPEQARGEEVDQRSDIFSFGIVLYEILAAHLPFRGEHIAAIQYSILNEEPPPLARYNEKVTDELQRIVSKALEKDREERYQHIDDLLADLRRERKHLEYARTGYVSQKPIDKTSALDEKKDGTVRISQKSQRTWSMKRFKKPLILIGMIAALMAAFFIIKPLVFDEMLVSEPKPVAVIAFVNQTGDRAYDYLQDAIPNLLITSLEQSKYLRVMTWERMHDVLKQMGKSDVDRIDKELGFELCQMEGIHAIVIGSYIKAGETFATDVKVLDVNTKELLKSTSARGEGVQSILNSQIDELSREISRGVGLSEKKIAVSSQQIASVTTNSMEAYSYFLKGREQYEKGYWLECLPSLERAVIIDSTFAMAYLYLARAYATRANIRERDKNYEKAKAFALKVSEKERLYIEASYAGVIEKNPQKRFEILFAFAERFPKEKEIYFDLGVYYWNVNKIKESVDALEKALALDPNYGKALNQIAYVYGSIDEYERALEYLKKYAIVSPREPDPFDSMGDIYFFIGDMQKAIDNYKEALAIKPEFFSSYKLAYIYGLLEEYPAAVEWIDYFMKNSPPSVTMGGARAWKSLYYWMMGERRRSVLLKDEAKRLWSAIENRSFVAGMDYFRAWQELGKGNSDSGQAIIEKSVQSMIELNPSQKANFIVLLEIYRGLVALLKEDIKTAKEKVISAESQIPYVTPIWESQIRYECAMFRGSILLAEGKIDSAILISKKAKGSRPWNLGGASMAFYSNISFYPPFRDVTARAYLKKGELSDAIAAYERLTTFNPDEIDRRLITPEYHYYLAKLYEQAGQKEKAVRRYEKFLSIWKSADAELPELIDAKARLSKLKRVSKE